RLEVETDNYIALEPSNHEIDDVVDVVEVVDIAEVANIDELAGIAHK
nr:hypothetical protein [Tanacetum cinerariifolium]